MHGAWGGGGGVQRIEALLVSVKADRPAADYAIMATALPSAPTSPEGWPGDALLIPRVIHRIWPGDDPMPTEFESFGESWSAHHPGWDIKLWRPSDLPPLRNQAQFDAADSYALRSDIARYELLLRYGGIYADTDFECLRSFEALLAGVEAFIGTEDGHHLTNALMGAVPGHPLLKAIVAAIPSSVAAHPEWPPNKTTGPHLVTAVVEADPRLRERLMVCEPELFYPYLYNELYRQNEEFPSAYAVHHWRGGWLSQPPTQVAPRYRAVVATDWTQTAPVRALLRAFAFAFGSEDPVELVLAVPHEPGTGDLQQAQALLEGLRVDPHECASITLESFTEAPATPFDVAVVPTGDPDGLVLEVAEAVDRLHELRMMAERHGRPAMAAARGETVLAGDRADLERRLRAFSATVTRPALAPRPAGTSAHRATYLGEDRLLVSTSWGGKLFMSASDLSLTPEVLHDGNYDEPFTRFLERTLRPGDVAFDIGANVGLFTVLMGRLVGPSGQILAYEAAPANVTLLRDTIAMNYYGDRVEVIAKAAAATTERLQFYGCTRFLGNGSLLPHDASYQDDFQVDDECVVTVEAEPLDIHAGRFSRIDLIKIDVEGGEEQVLAGMEMLIGSGTVKRICLELLRDRMGSDWEPITRRLRKLSAAGWSTAILGERGESIAIELDQVLERGRFSQLLLERPGTTGTP